MAQPSTTGSRASARARTQRGEVHRGLLTSNLPQWVRMLASSALSGTILRCVPFSLSESPEGLSPGVHSCSPLTNTFF